MNKEFIEKAVANRFEELKHLVTSANASRDLTELLTYAKENGFSIRKVNDSYYLANMWDLFFVTVKNASFKPIVLIQAEDDFLTDLVDDLESLLLQKYHHNIYVEEA